MWNNKSSSGFKFRPRLKMWTDGVNNKFNPETFRAISYNWWTYCIKLKNGLVIFNNYSYSVSTSGHQNSMLKLLDQLGIPESKIIMISQRESLDVGIVLDSIYTKMYLAEFTLTRKGLRKQKYKDCEKTIESCKQKIKTLRAAGGKTLNNLKNLKTETIQKEIDRLECSREKAQKLRAKQKPIIKELKPKLNDLNALDLNVFNNLNNMGEI
ncbi:MAG: hypothetical protein ACRCST_00620 [Turicibacter sp.]